MYFFKKAAFILMIVLLASAFAGCGGGASDSSGTLSLTVTSPSASTQPGTAVATYTAANGQNPIGVEISFSTDSTVIALDSTKQSVGSDGTATVTFRALPVATDTTAKIIASTGGLSQFQVITIKATAGAPPITPPSGSATPQSISFLSAAPSQINLKGFGTSVNPETSIVTFVVKDTAGNPLSGVTVDFSLDTTVGGITIIPTSGVSNSSGQAMTIVTSGTMATPVRVTATVHGSSPAITAQSTQLVIAGGPPDQDSLSIALSTAAPEAFNIDGTTVAVIARLADHFGNPVANGTAVYFTTNGGSIQSSCITSGGTCTVTWTSQNPRPTTPGINPAVAAILAYAVGEESFTDVNNNSIADSGTCSSVFLRGIGLAKQCGEFTDTPDAYRDDNLNGIHDANEPFYNLTGSTTYSGPDGIYEGSFVSPASTNPRSKYIFFNRMLIMSGSFASNVALATQDVPLGTSVSPDTLTVTDVNGNQMPSGTTINVTVNAGSGSACLKVTPTSQQVLDPGMGGLGGTIGLTDFQYTITNSCSSFSGATDSLTFAIKTPKGSETDFTIPMNY